MVREMGEVTTGSLSWSDGGEVCFEGVMERVEACGCMGGGERCEQRSLRPNRRKMQRWKRRRRSIRVDE